MIIIGITGTIGAGKGTIVDYLVEKKKFKHFSVRKFITEEIVKRGMNTNRDSMVIVANDLRKQNTSSYIIDCLYDRAKKSNNNCVIESVRTVGEIESLRKKSNFYLFAVDAEQKIRYERIKKRGSETDNIDFNTFIENENREMQSTDKNHQNLKNCIKLANYIFYNDGTISELENKLEDVINKILISQTTKAVKK